MFLLYLLSSPYPRHGHMSTITHRKLEHVERSVHIVYSWKSSTTSCPMHQLLSRGASCPTLAPRPGPPGRPLTDDPSVGAAAWWSWLWLPFFVTFLIQSLFRGDLQPPAFIPCHRNRHSDKLCCDLVFTLMVKNPRREEE